MPPARLFRPSRAFSYTIDAAAELTANFKAINIYELAYTVSGGANDYQVQALSRTRSSRRPQHV